MKPVAATECSEPKATILMWIPSRHSTLLGTGTALAASEFQIKTELILTSSTNQYPTLKSES